MQSLRSRKMGKGAGRRGLAGSHTLVALLTCALALAVWKAANGYAQAPARFDHKVPERIWWMGAKLGPSWKGADLESADLIFAGDSRIKAGIDLPLARSEGLPSVSRIWCGGGNTSDLLKPLLEWEEPRSLVVSLTPLGFAGLPNRHVGETLRALNPACDPNVAPWQVERWTIGEKAHLIEAGFDPMVAEGTMRWWMKKYQAMRSDHKSTKRWINTPRIDQGLNGYVDRLRSLWLYPMEPSTWNRSWWRKENSGGSNHRYTQSLSPRNQERIDQGYQDLKQVILELKDKGWRVAAIRMPIAPTLHAVEENSAAANRVDQLVAELEIPYKDFGTWPGATIDGSHLNMAAAARVTTEIAAWVHGIWPT
ncbi:MAG: hypothetical protein P1V35_11415, partial [Planctomycetota bacterium]|nr:hypothetical protein [Planctomycetota bacterium]